MNKEILSRFFETMNEEVSPEAFSTIYDDAVVFKDPFNEVRVSERFILYLNICMRRLTLPDLS